MERRKLNLCIFRFVTSFFPIDTFQSGFSNKLYISSDNLFGDSQIIESRWKVKAEPPQEIFLFQLLVNRGKSVS